MEFYNEKKALNFTKIVLSHRFFQENFLKFLEQLFCRILVSDCFCSLRSIFLLAQESKIFSWQVFLVFFYIHVCILNPDLLGFCENNRKWPISGRYIKSTPCNIKKPVEKKQIFGKKEILYNVQIPVCIRARIMMCQTKMVACIGFDMQINFFSPNYLFEPRVMMLFKCLATLE